MTTVIVPIIQVKELKFKEAKGLTQSCWTRIQVLIIIKEIAALYWALTMGQTLAMNYLFGSLLLLYDIGVIITLSIVQS